VREAAKTDSVIVTACRHRSPKPAAKPQTRQQTPDNSKESAFLSSRVMHGGMLPCRAHRVGFVTFNLFLLPNFVAVLWLALQLRHCPLFPTSPHRSTPAPHHRTLQRRTAKAWGGGKIYSTGPAAAGVPFSTKVAPMHKISPLPRHSHNNPSPPGSSRREEAGSLRCQEGSKRRKRRGWEYADDKTTKGNKKEVSAENDEDGNNDQNKEIEDSGEEEEEEDEDT